MLQTDLNLITTIIAFLMIADAGFTLTNLTRVETLIHQLFPQLDVKKLAWVEGLVGLVILVVKSITDSFT